MKPALWSLISMLLVLPACSSAKGADSATKPSASSTAPASAPAASGGPATGGPRLSTPGSPLDAPREAVNPDPNFDYGYVVQITPAGFHPQWLVSGCCKAVTWKNLTDSPTSVVFDHQLVDSGPIAPGGSFVFTPHNVQSIAYHSGTNSSMVGVLQVNQTFES
jgi:hypothetical protein